MRNVDEARERHYEAARNSVGVTGRLTVSTIRQLLARDQAQRDNVQGD